MKMLFRHFVGILLIGFFSTNSCFTTGYDKDFLALLETVYGEGFLSQGKSQALEQMFHGIDLNGKKLLDIGSGLGGLDFELASKFNVCVVGVDPLEEAIQQARKKLALVQKTLKGKVSFRKLDVDNQVSLAMFPDNNFDILFSREALLHVPVDKKVIYFKEMLRVLKPGGLLIVVDWTHRTPDYSKVLERLIREDGLEFNMVTLAEYKENLRKAGFIDVSFEDDTSRYVEFSKENCKTIIKLEKQIKSRFDKEMYDGSISGWDDQKKVFEKRDVIVVNIRAYKQILAS